MIKLDCDMIRREVKIDLLDWLMSVSCIMKSDETIFANTGEKV